MAIELSLEQFSPLQGRSFAVQLDEGAALQAELVEARALPMPPFQGRQPFSLLFKGPPAPLLPQRIYSLRQEGVAEPIEIFLVPVSADPSGACYEAVFT
jgi:hypothetical protein